MYVRQLPLGPMKNFVYLLGPGEGREAMVVDPAWDAPAILQAAEVDGRAVAAIFLTHSHHDHINAVDALLQARDVPVYVQRAEHDFSPAVRGWGGATRLVTPGERVPVGALEVTCVHTPGHTPGAQCLLCGTALVSGDTLFVNACGRCDLPGGDVEAMYSSLHRTLGALDGSTTLYPGHDYGDVPVSTLQRERTTNPYLRATDRDAFVRARMGPKA